MGELLTGRDHDDLAVFIRQINLAVSRNGRRAEAAADHGQALSIQFLACLQVVSVERAVVREHVEDAVVDERRRHVRTATGAAPDDGVAARLAVGKRKVAARAGLDDEYRSFWSTTTYDHEHIVREDRSRRSDLRAASESPQFFSGPWIVAANEVRSVCDQFLAF